MVGRIWIYAAVMGLFLGGTSAWADIYSWTDENGVRSYSNTAPPEKVMTQRRSEIPFNPAADDARRTAERQARTRRKIELEAERNDQLEEQLRQTQQRLERLESKAREALDTAKKAKQAGEKAHKQRRVYRVFPYPVPYRGFPHHPEFKPKPGLKPNTGVIGPAKIHKRTCPANVVAQKAGRDRCAHINSAIFFRRP